MSEKPLKDRLPFILLADLLAFTGILLAGYLFFLSALAWPCWGGGCSEVLRSTYANLDLGFGDIPIALPAIFAWVALFFVPLVLGKIILALMLVGAGFLVFLQVFEIGAFCLWCNIHHFLVLLLLFLPARPQHRFLATLALLLLFPILLLEQARISQHLPDREYRYVPEAEETEESDAEEKEKTSPRQTRSHLLWDNPEATSRAIMVLNLDCPECLVKLDQLAESFAEKPRLPRVRTRVFFLSSEEIFSHQALFLAALFPPETSFPEGIREHWPILSQHFQEIPRWRELPVEEWEALLEMDFPHIASAFSDWQDRLRQQQKFLNQEGLQVTPLLIDEEGWTTNFSVSGLLLKED
ncbi:MAG: hypothetical protein JJT75_04175 [Opitutales bacterium]|nr:hypothetical protein [Opitutales bacterium]MCH8541244.1 hypothetical protein [Opitutales bacterium]